jgi:predicted phage-related endonuclease
LTAERLSEQEGREIKLHRVNKALSPTDAAWITGHIDRRIVGEKRGVEIKNVGWRMMKHWGAIDTDELPAHYLAQVHTYLYASDYDEWTVAAYFGGPDLRMYRVLRDLDMDHLIREATGRFWHEHVLKRVPPPVDFGHSTTLRAIKRMYAGTNGEIVIATDEIKAWSKVRESAREAAKRYEAVAAGADSHLLEFMGEGAILDLGDGTRYTRKVVNRKGYTAVVEPTSYVDFRFGKTKE